MKRRRAKKKKNNYFTLEHEAAIVEYARSDCFKRRTELYGSLIQPALSQLVDKIIYTYKFVNLPNIDSLRDECKIWLTTILDKYNPEKGSRAFSYFSVVTKHWFMHQFKKNQNKNRKESSYEQMIETGNSELKNLTVSQKDVLETNLEKEFWILLMEQIESWDSPNLKENEKKVLEAIKILFKNIDELEILNKKAVYLYLREITGLNTKQVVNNLKRVREKYRNFRNKWHDGEI